MSTDLRLLRNSDEFKIKYWNSKFPTINDLHTIVQDDNSVTDIETKKPLFYFKEIDDDPDNTDNKCLIFITSIMKTSSFSKDGTKKQVPTESVATGLQQTNNKLNTKCVFKESCDVWQLDTFANQKDFKILVVDKKIIDLNDNIKRK